jgi:hypothetical protein
VSSEASPGDVLALPVPKADPDVARKRPRSLRVCDNLCGDDFRLCLLHGRTHSPLVKPKNPTVLAQTVRTTMKAHTPKTRRRRSQPSASAYSLHGSWLPSSTPMPRVSVVGVPTAAARRGRREGGPNAAGEHDAAVRRDLLGELHLTAVVDGLAVREAAAKSPVPTIAQSTGTASRVRLQSIGVALGLPRGCRRGRPRHDQPTRFLCSLGGAPSRAARPRASTPAGRQCSSEGSLQVVGTVALDAISPREAHALLDSRPVVPFLRNAVELQRYSVPRVVASRASASSAAFKRCVSHLHSSCIALHASSKESFTSHDNAIRSLPKRFCPLSNSSLSARHLEYASCKSCISNVPAAVQTPDFS